MSALRECENDARMAMLVRLLPLPVRCHDVINTFPLVTDSSWPVEQGDERVPEVEASPMNKRLDQEFCGGVDPEKMDNPHITHSNEKRKTVREYGPMNAQ